MAKSVVINLPN